MSPTHEAGGLPAFFHFPNATEALVGWWIWGVPPKNTSLGGGRKEAAILAWASRPQAALTWRREQSLEEAARNVLARSPSPTTEGAEPAAPLLAPTALHLWGHEGCWEGTGLLANLRAPDSPWVLLECHGWDWDARLEGCSLGIRVRR